MPIRDGTKPRSNTCMAMHSTPPACSRNHFGTGATPDASVRWSDGKSPLPHFAAAPDAVMGVTFLRWIEPGRVAASVRSPIPAVLPWVKQASSHSRTPVWRSHRPQRGRCANSLAQQNLDKCTKLYCLTDVQPSDRRIANRIDNHLTKVAANLSTAYDA